MNTRPYQIITSLLFTSVVAVLALQAFWIRNFYTQKKEEFDRTVFQAMEQVSRKLQEREGLKQIKQEVTINSGRTGTPGKKIVIQRSTSGSSEIRVEALNTSSAGSLDSIKKITERLSSSSSSSTNYYKPSPGGVYAIAQSNSSTKIADGEMDVLINKMLLEIKVMDVDSVKPSVLKNLISQALTSKGLLMPFEFAVKNTKSSAKPLLTSSGKFDSTASSYTYDLSADRVLPSGKFLLLQFSGKAWPVLASMKGTLVLSLLFSLTILVVFYYTMRLILKQKKLSEIKNDFINNMTHELKTPIATIALATDAINNPQVKNDAQKFADYTRILKEENQKLNSHVERVLQMALIDKGELQLKKQRLSLLYLLENAIKSFRLQIESQEARVKLHAPDDAMANADEQHLQAAINNLLDNALKYSANNCQVDVYLSCNEGFATVRFKDNGIGITEDNKERIFDKFYRVQGGNLHDVKGFGLGLSYVRSIVEAHGGKIELKSAAGRGSEFILTLPQN